jgi:phosphopantothenoylcysteine decarboxylase/phosphopantothenate--cysteine ligase
MTRKQLKILITAGPTIEPIDPVRFISNRSTGAMGRAVAAAAKKRGHRVILIGPGENLSAGDLHKRVLENFKRIDAVVMAAAVSDYRPVKTARQKIKKTKSVINLKLVKNPDILSGLAKVNKDKILVGFALETGGLYKNSMKKLKEKNLDFIVANRLTKRQDIFGEKKTSVLIIDKNGNRERFNSVSKDKIAARIIEKLEEIKVKI